MEQTELRVAGVRVGPRFGKLFLALVLAGCADIGEGGQDSVVRPKTFAPVVPLTPALVTGVVAAAANAANAPNVAIAVLDRIGNPLRLYLGGISVRTGLANPDLTADLTAAERERLNFATAVARAAAYLSHSQAPLTSRTGQFLSSFHFPVVFDKGRYLTAPPDSFSGLSLPVQATIGVANTAQAPLWQIDASNRGTPFASAATTPATAYNGTPIPVATNPDGTAPSPGLGPLPGGVPLYDASNDPLDTGQDVVRRLIGSIGVYVTDGAGVPMPDLAEFMAVAGAQAQLLSGEPFDIGVRPQGAVFLAGILLPNVDPDAAGTPLGLYEPNDEVSPFSALQALSGVEDPGEQYLIGPVASAAASGPTAVEVMTIIDACRAVSQETHAAIRLPSDSPCRMIITVCDVDGVILGAFREVDATLFSLEISLTKARNAVFFANPASRWTSDVAEAGVLAGLHPLIGFRARRDLNGDPLPILDASGNLISANGDIVDIFPPSMLTTTGVAVTARTLGFLSQPFYPPGIDGADQAGPLYFLAQKNRFPGSHVGQGFAARFGSGDINEPTYADTLSGIIFFPGSAPLYRNGTLIGGIGVSGDGVEQDDFVTAKGILRAQQQLGFALEPLPDMRADHFSFEGAGIPYFKFPQNPGG